MQSDQSNLWWMAWKFLYQEAYHYHEDCDSLKIHGFSTFFPDTGFGGFYYHFYVTVIKFISIIFQYFVYSIFKYMYVLYRWWVEQNPTRSLREESNGGQFTTLLICQYFWYTYYFTYYSSYIIWTIFPVQNYTDNKISLQSKFKLLSGWGSDLTLINNNFEMASFKTTFGSVYKMSVSLSKRLQLPPRLYRDIIRS